MFALPAFDDRDLVGLGLNVKLLEMVLSFGCGFGKYTS